LYTPTLTLLLIVVNHYILFFHFSFHFFINVIKRRGLKNLNTKLKVHINLILERAKVNRFDKMDPKTEKDKDGKIVEGKKTKVRITLSSKNMKNVEKCT
jgi:hypothetical protein